MLALALACLAATGCVQRRMVIRSNPPGAMVYVDDYEIGTTPIAHDFTYYGTRKIRLVKDGYETLTVMQSIPAPWYQIPPLDFVSENLVPGELRDRRTLLYTLRPQMIVPPEELRGRAEELRGRSRTPLAPAPPGAAPLTTTPAMAPPTLNSPPSIPPGAFVPPQTTSPQTLLPPGTGGTMVHPLPN
jgi:hypothetical protein